MQLGTFPSSYLRPTPLHVSRSLPLLPFQKSTLLVFPSVYGMLNPYSQVGPSLQAFGHSPIKRKTTTTTKLSKTQTLPWPHIPSSHPHYGQYLHSQHIFHFLRSYTLLNHSTSNPWSLHPKSHLQSPWSPLCSLMQKVLRDLHLYSISDNYLGNIIEQKKDLCPCGATFLDMSWV